MNTIIEILEARNQNVLASLLKHSYFKVRESSNYGSALYSLVSTAEIFSPPVVNEKLINLADNEKKEILEAFKTLYPPRDGQPEVHYIEFLIDSDFEVLFARLSKKVKNDLLIQILNENEPLGRNFGEDWPLNFLMKIWDLNSMPSEDTRYKTAYQDAFQHLVMNNDWDLHYLFLNRFPVTESDREFKKFLEEIVHPRNRVSEEDILKFVNLINQFIEQANLTMQLSDFDDSSMPIYLVCEQEGKPSDLPSKSFTFFVDTKLTGISTSKHTHHPPAELPAFVLAANLGWNDYNFKTLFSLFFHSENEIQYVGEVKISDGISRATANSLPKTFQKLEGKYCSLGQSFEYYQNLEKITGPYFRSVLYDLKDCAFYHEVSEDNEKNEIFLKSLTRSDVAERILRVCKHFILGYDLNNLFSFKFVFKPNFSDSAIEVPFDFSNKSDQFDRVFGVIGKNGVGKTQLLSQLPLCISQKNDERFFPKTPLFSKVIAVSYSLFDNFEKPRRNSLFNYIFCGLTDQSNQLLSFPELKARFFETWQRIIKLGRIDKCRKILFNLLDDELVNSIFEDNLKKNDDNRYSVNFGALKEIIAKLSSGQNILLFIISEIISNIRLDSLILFDEPETHLHPNAVSQLAAAIFELVHEFESYCIISTHSPVVLQELFAKNTFILERFDNYPSIRKIGLETFGENLTVITEEVFGSKKINKHYKMTIDRLIKDKKSYTDIVSELRFANGLLPLNVELYIKSQISK